MQEEGSSGVWNNDRIAGQIHAGADDDNATGRGVSIVCAVVVAFAEGTYCIYEPIVLVCEMPFVNERVLDI